MTRNLLSILPVLALCLWLCTAASSRLVKRSDDLDPLEAVVSQLSQTVAGLQAEIAALKSSKADNAVLLALQTQVRSLQTITAEHKVAFLARVDVDVAANAPIPFHAVDFNVGNAYDPLSGIFTAPHSGVYLLSTQIFPQFAGDVLVDLYKNGGIIIRMRVFDSTSPTSESTSITDHANAGDKYWVQVNVGGHIYAGAHSFFSVTIVFPDS
ncbi:hypothetical protein C0Q70_20141 [Pomacea canaliculata]|uniref:C1q domain-containing protein n=1 Tax=Pomacea canaliculata TaxID=400727 RepID=A0A2T7NEQ8_POMCA|nr:complement C1q-like protein 4 [Pomacea canaliculata]PVD19651.1 hypothetical protein C0Q70_20141 [Pomacea canaliculata]